MIQRIVILALLIFSYSLSVTIPEKTDLVVTDSDGKTYNIDALLSSGKHIVVHQTGST